MNLLLRAGLVFLLLMSIALIYQTNTALACSCVPNPDPEAALKNADAVFSGKVTEITRTGFIEKSRAVKIETQTIWKGSKNKHMLIYTAEQSASCGYEFAVGKEYIIYAYDHDGELHTGLCSRTALLKDAGEDLHALGKGSPPDDNQSLNMPLSSSEQWTYSGIGTVLLAGTVLAVVRRRKR
ncbi:hypothetical protein ACFQPF_08095 [Fictibacillus iocasae]|uniref:Tissue inhibitor of metalloproteinase n=1 Tax=Fictibacillus iocasae TaxID=2715437 RepID=A0ABW2NLW5_9BACL